MPGGRGATDGARVWRAVVHCLSLGVGYLPMLTAINPVLFLLCECSNGRLGLTETVAANKRLSASSLAITFSRSRGRAAAKCRWRQWVIRVATEGPGPFAYTDADLSRTTLRLRSPGDNAAMSPTMGMPYVSIKS